MTNLKYADRLISDVGFEATHGMKVDRNRLPDFMSVDCTWFWRSQPNQIVDGTRISPENQVIGLVGAYPEDPFHTLDIDGVGELLTLGAGRGRQVNPDVTLSICGEHGGNPESIEFCRDAGFDYVSCSPFRVPIARLAAAHAALQGSMTKDQ